MSRVRVSNFAISADGYGAGPGQTLEKPMGEGADHLHDWFRTTRTWAKMIGKEGGATGPDDEFSARSMENLGAWIMGRNMFGPVRGEWPNGEWKGWWGDNPPYHVPVYVLTHHAREPLKMAGDTVFHFVTGGIHEALSLAKKAAGTKDIRIGGGVSTVRQYLQAGLIDEMHLAIAPTLLGSGEHLLHGIDLPKLGFSMKQHVTTDHAMHVVFSK